jgi:spore germination protein YaaH
VAVPGADAPVASHAQTGSTAAAQPLQSSTATAAAPNTLRHEVFGFAYSGSLGDPTVGYPSWNFDDLSTVAFFAIHVQYDGQLVGDSNFAVWDSSVLTGLVNTAHAHGTKVVVTIVGPSNPIDQCDALYNGKRQTIPQLIQEVTRKGVDGVNIDYEGQLTQCQNIIDPTLNATNQSLTTNFARDMRAGLDAVRPGYYLSIDTYSGSAAGNDGRFNIGDLNQYVDSFFVMTYDMDYANQPYPPLNCSSFCLAPVSPLANYYWNDTTSMTQYSALVGPGKTILGQPYYGTVACVASPADHATATSSPVTATYLDAASVASSPDVQQGTFVIHRDGTDPNGLDRWDSWYDNKVGCWREMYWSDTVTLGVRYNLVNQMNLRGVGFWTLNYAGGSGELWSALATYFKSCSAMSASAAPPSTAGAGTPVSITGSATGCSNPLYEFWILPPGGPWVLAQAYSSSPTLNWTTTGKPAGSYRFSVWARDAHSQGTSGTSPNMYDAFSAFQYTLTISPCTAMSASASPASTASVGAAVSITASASGCPNPLYEFWLLPPGGPWVLAQAYSSSPTFNWTTSGKATGSYRFSVWARDANSPGTSGTSPNTYDAFSAFQYTLTITPCSAMSASAAPPSTAGVGTPVSITGSATGCPNPLYEFWILPPGGPWILAQAYSSSPTFNWTTSVQPAGSYRFSVWARDTSSPGTSGTSPNTYDAFSAFQYVLTISPCSAMSASASPPSTATAGTPVSITASATGCSNPLYEFWLLPPGGPWVLAQAYSSSPTFNWTTTGQPAGSYRFSVWARDASSPGTSGTSPNKYDAFSAFQYTLA